MDESDLIQYEGGEVLANLEERTITGLLIPYNELGHTNAGRFMVEAGTFPNLPEDPAVVGINTDHERSRTVGRATRVWEEARGIMASFTIARTPEGDDALADAINPNGKRRRLSAEFHTAIKAGKAVRGTGRLWGAALVERGAFPSAMVLAADRSADSADMEVHRTRDFIARKAPTSTPVEVDNQGGNTTMADQAPVAAEAVAPITPAPAAEAQPVAVAAQAVTPTPATHVQNAPVATTQPVDDSRQVLAALATLRRNPIDGEAMQVLAAIADITMSGTNTLPGSGVLRPNWLGKLYQGIPYVREFANNLGTLGTDITAAGKLGMKVFRGTAASPLGPQDGTWQGNKNPINGYRGDSNTIGSLLYRFAVGNDIDRSLYDLPGGWEVVEEFLKLIIEDYLFWSDRIARETFISAAGAPVAAKTYPTNYPAALGMLIQGALAVKKRKTDGRRDVPTVALANDIAFEQLAYTVGGDQNLPAFVKLSLASITTPQSEVGSVDDTLIVVNGDTGTQATANVIVGSKLAIDFDELPGGPLIINAVDLAKGGIDQATHGYFQTFVKRPEAFANIGTPDNWAATTAVAVGGIMKNGAGVLQATVAGTTAGTAPTNPAVGSTVVDGTVTWKRLS